MSSQDQLATIRYLTPTDQRPVYHASTAGADARFDIDVGFEERTVPISDARPIEPAPDLDKQGFELVAHRSAVKDFYSLSAQLSVYENELVALICACTGADGAKVFDHTLRSDSAAIRGQRVTREPASFIHNDYTAASAKKRLVDVVGQESANSISQSRFAIVNVWRPVRGPVWNSPIACCDASTLAPEDLVAAERRAEDRVGEIEFVSWNPSHRWFYFPMMTCDEVLLIKTFDSAGDDRAKRCVHTSFKNALAPPGSPPRESIESRLLVFFNGPSFTVT